MYMLNNTGERMSSIKQNIGNCLPS